jgi:predicted PurR-regulated permease PerM
LSLLAVLAVFYTLFLAREFLLPVILALLLALLLNPLMHPLRQLRLPDAICAAIVVFGLIGAIAGTGYALSTPAAKWVQEAPGVLYQLQRKVNALRQTVREVSQTAEQVERLAQSPNKPPVVQLQGQGLRDIILARLRSIAIGTVMATFLLYFMLASGDRFQRKLLSTMPTFRDKRRTLEISRHVQREVSAYLFTFALINIGLATVTSLTMYLLGLPNPVLWGALAGVLNFVPYLGPATVLTVLAIVATLTFDQLHAILLPPGAFLIITSLEGQLLTPMILGRRLALSPIVIFLGLIFWGWLWGVLGALLAVPIMVSIKIVCDHIEPLQPIGIMMER